MQQSDLRNTGTSQRSPAFLHFYLLRDFRGKFFMEQHILWFFSVSSFTLPSTPALDGPQVFLGLSTCPFQSVFLFFNLFFNLLPPPPWKASDRYWAEQESLGQTSQCSVTHTELSCQGWGRLQDFLVFLGQISFPVISGIVYLFCYPRPFKSPGCPFFLHFLFKKKNMWKAWVERIKKNKNISLCCTSTTCHPVLLIVVFYRVKTVWY